MHDDLHLQPPLPDGTPGPDARNPGATVEQLSEMVDQIRSHYSRSQRRVERIERQYESLARYVLVLWILLILVTLGFGVFAWYEAPALTGQRALLKDLPIKDPQITEASAKQAESAIPPHNLESSEAGSAGAIVPPSAGVPEKAPSAAIAIPREGKERQTPEVPADNVSRQRIDFRLGGNQTVQIAPGIYLTIKATNVSQQEVDGWLQIARSGRIVWIRAQAAEKSLSFVSQNDSHPSFLVFTRIDSNGVAGYLMMIPPSPRSG